MFDELKMKEDEEIVAYLLQVDKIVNIIKGLGVEFYESVVVQKVFRSLPMRFDPKNNIPRIKRISQYIDHG
jgi:hypothetical protein